MTRDGPPWFLPTNPAALVRFPARVTNFNFYPGTMCVCVCVCVCGFCVYPLSVFCPVFSLAVALHSADHRFQGDPPLSICLMF